MKQCKKSGCINPVFSHLYCKRHQYLRTDDKSPFKSKISSKQTLSPKKGYKIPKRSKKPLNEAKTQWGFKTQPPLFRYIWNQVKPNAKCPISGMPIEKYRWSNLYAQCCGHVLPKGRYPELKLCPDNIILIHPLVHNIADKGTEDDKKATIEKLGWDWSMWEEREQKMKELSKTLTKIVKK